MLGIYDEAKVAELIHLPADMKIAVLIPIGYPAISPEAPRRKEVSDLLRFI
jgi:nitroreductase